MLFHFPPHCLLNLGHALPGHGYLAHNRCLKNVGSASLLPHISYFPTMFSTNLGIQEVLNKPMEIWTLLCATQWLITHKAKAAGSVCSPLHPVSKPLLNS